MKLDRNVNVDRKGKYALVRLRGIEKNTEAYNLLSRLCELGHLDWGSVGERDEFFVIKLRDRFSDSALDAYSAAVMKASGECEDEAKSKDLAQYAIQVQSMIQRAGILNEFCKDPD